MMLIAIERFETINMRCVCERTFNIISAVQNGWVWRSSLIEYLVACTSELHHFVPYVDTILCISLATLSTLHLSFCLSCLRIRQICRFKACVQLLKLKCFPSILHFLINIILLHFLSRYAKWIVVNFWLENLWVISKYQAIIEWTINWN